MNGAHLHLMLNHFPIAGVIFSILLLLVAWRSGEESLRRASLFLIVVTGLLTIPAFLTGESAEKVVEQLPQFAANSSGTNITQALIEAHEEAAEKAAWAVWGTSIVALAGLIHSFKRKATAGWVLPVVIVFSLGCIGLFAWSNNLGGRISHSELRAN